MTDFEKTLLVTLYFFNMQGYRTPCNCIIWWVNMTGKVKRKNVLLFIPAMPDSVAVDTVNRDGASPSLSPSVTAVKNISKCRTKKQFCYKYKKNSVWVCNSKFVWAWRSNLVRYEVIKYNYLNNILLFYYTQIIFLASTWPSHWIINSQNILKRHSM